MRISVLEVGPQNLIKHPDGRAGRFVCLSMIDTGCGIEPENLPHIFEPFFTTKEVGRARGSVWPRFTESQAAPRLGGGGERTECGHHVPCIFSKQR